MKVAGKVEEIIFASRWLMAPMYLGLVLVLALALVRFAFQLWKMISEIGESDMHVFTMNLLSLIDLILLGNLVIIVLFAGYENFVSKLDAAEDHEDRPRWLGTLDFSSLKMKLLGSLVAISVIELLKDFILLSGMDHVAEGTIWRIIIHLVFLTSGLLFALMDSIAAATERSQAAALAGEPQASKKKSLSTRRSS